MFWLVLVVCGLILSMWAWAEASGCPGFLGLLVFLSWLDDFEAVCSDPTAL